MFSFRDKLRAVTATVELIREERIRSLSLSFDICSTCTQHRIMRLCSYGIRTWSVCGKQLQADCSQGNGRVDLRVKDTILVVIVLRQGFFQKHQASGKDAVCMTYDQLAIDRTFCCTNIQHPLSFCLLHLSRSQYNWCKQATVELFWILSDQVTEGIRQCRPAGYFVDNRAQRVANVES